MTHRHRTGSHARRAASRVAAIAAVLIAGAAGASWAQDEVYPARPVRIVVPTGAGASLDTIARGLAIRLQARLGSSFYVENKPGANATLGSDFVARAAPDGYTLLYTGPALAVNPSLYRNAPDPEKAFKPIASVALGPITLVVPNSSPFARVDALIVAAKKSPGVLTYGSAGHGSPPDLAAKLFEAAAVVQLTHVPYKGAAEALGDVLGERLDLMFPSLTLAAGFIESGKLRVLGVASETRSALAPQIPTVGEMGLPGFHTSTWSGLVAPAGTAPAVVSVLETAVTGLLADDGFKGFLRAQGLEPDPRSSRAFAKLIAEETSAAAKSRAR